MCTFVIKLLAPMNISSLESFVSFWSGFIQVALRGYPARRFCMPAKFILFGKSYKKNLLREATVRLIFLPNLFS